MSNEAPISQQQVAESFEDFDLYKGNSRLNTRELFDPQFLDFMKWLRVDVKKSFTNEDFRRIERHEILTLFLGYPLLFAVYLYLHAYAPEHAVWWGIPMFGIAVWLCIRGEGIHMRAHNPVTLTGSRWVDKAIDTFGMAASGISQSLFRRRHLAAHYNDVGSVSKAFSSVWLTYDKVPLLNYLRPWMPLKIVLDEAFCRKEGIDRRLLAVETVFFYLYLGLMAVELFVFHSYFLLMFHMLPGLWVAGSQIIGATFVHAGFDGINSFDSNGLFDPKTAKGLIKVPIVWFGLFNAKFFINHAIHHAWPQIPLKIINDNYERYYDYILTHYKGVRYNSVLSAYVHRDLLARMPEPTWFDYVVAFLVSLVGHVFMVVTALGLPIPPVVFELAMVDWRIFFMTTKEERIRAKLTHLDNCRILERFSEIPNPNTYLKFYVWWYGKMKAQLAEIEASRAAAGA